LIFDCTPVSHVAILYVILTAGRVSIRKIFMGFILARKETDSGLASELSKLEFMGLMKHLQWAKAAKWRTRCSGGRTKRIAGKCIC